MSFTLNHVFEQVVSRHPSAVGFRHKASGEWRAIRYDEMHERVVALAAGFLELGIEKGDRIAQMSENRPEWIQTDLAIHRVGAIHVPVYQTLTAPQIREILLDCQPRLIVVSGESFLRRMLEAIEGLDFVQQVLMLDPLVSGELPARVAQHGQLVERGRAALEGHRQTLESRMASVAPDDVASIIYTSGTTGKPKGAMLTHANFASNVKAARELIGITHEHSCLSFLPLSHVFERTAHYVFLSAGATIHYAESIEAVPANLLEVRPIFIASVPRVFEKLRTRILTAVGEAPFLRRALFEWAMRVGGEVVDRRMAGQSIGPLLATEYQIAEQLVFSKVRERVGGRLRFAIAGGAPLSAEVGKFFLILGIDVLEGYGLTETSPVIACNRPGMIRLGTVGKPIDGVEVRIADDGEILARGPNIMKGYFGNEEATRQAIDPEGWFHTGDIGAFDADGFLRITDRKKEILVMSNGKNVAPAPIENALVVSPLIEQAMVVGDNRNFISALVVPSFDALERLARERGWKDYSRDRVTSYPAVREALAAEIQSRLRDFARFEQVKDFVVLDREFSLEEDEITPSLKLKRRNILRHNAEAIEQLYAAGRAPVEA